MKMITDDDSLKGTRCIDVKYEWIKRTSLEAGIVRCYCSWRMDGWLPHRTEIGHFMGQVCRVLHLIIYHTFNRCGWQFMEAICIINKIMRRHPANAIKMCDLLSHGGVTYGRTQASQLPSATVSPIVTLIYITEHVSVSYYRTFHRCWRPT